MNYTQVKNLKKFCESLFSQPDYREVLRHAGEDDFTVGNVRFIADDAIDEIQQFELTDDQYLLGCFNASFLSTVLGINKDVIDAMQHAEAYEVIGKLVVRLGKLPELQREYASADGYGHYFNGYDFGEEEVIIDGTLYHVFDNH